MAWGIPGNVGEIYAKQQSDELRDQLLKQEMAQRIRAFEAEQVYRQQQMAAQAEERRERAADRQSAREREGRQDTRELARDVLTTSVPGATTEAVAGPLSAYPGTAHLITRRNVLPSTALGGMSQEDTSGPQNFPVREPTPPELESTRERVRRGELTRVISGVNRADPNWRAKLAAQFAEQNPDAAFTQVMAQTPEERRTERRQDLVDAAVIHRQYNPPQPRERNPEWVIRNGVPVQIEKGTAQSGDKPYDAVAARSPEGGAPSPTAIQHSQDVITQVDEMLPRLGVTTTGLIGSVLSNVPGSEAKDVSADLKSLGAKIAFDQLQKMREASKTGGALGNVSDKETELLTNVAASIAQDQSWTNLEKNLKIVRASAQRFLEAAAQQGHEPLRPRQNVTMTPGGMDASKLPAPMRKPIPGIPGAEAESTDGGKTWKRVK